MGIFEHFPYTNFHELNSGWILQMMKELEAAWEQFTAGNSLTFADPLLYDATKSYPKNTIVLDNNGNAYVSIKQVGLGITPGNSSYWLMIFDYEAFLEKVNKNFTGRYYRDENRAKTAMVVGDWLTFDDVLCKATAAIAVDELLVVGGNIAPFTLEDFIKAFMLSANQLIQQYKNDIDASELAYRQQLAQDIADTTASLQAQLNAAIAGASVDSELINIRVAANNITYDTAGNAVRNQFRAQGDLLGINIPATMLGQYFVSNQGKLSGSGATTRSFYCECKAGHTYFIYKPISGATAVGMGEFASVPVEDDVSSNFVYSQQAYASLTLTAENDDYLVFYVGGRAVIDYLFIDITEAMFLKLGAKNLASNLVITSATQFSSLGITSIEDLPRNQNVIISKNALDPNNPTPTGLPSYTESFYLTKLSVNASWEYAIAATIKLNPDDQDFYVNVKNGTWGNWMKISDNYNGNPGTPIFFTVNVNQDDAHPTSTADSIIYETSFSDVQCVLRLPRSYSRHGKPTPLIMHCHGAGQYVSDNTYSGIDALDYMLADGYAIFDVNGGINYNDETGTKGLNAGGQRTIQAYYKAYEYIKEHYNIEDKIYVACKSSGGLAAINFANRYPNVVKVLGLCYPVTDLKGQAWDHPYSDIKVKMAKDYYFDDQSGNTYEPSKVIGFNPIESMTDGTGIFMNIPIKIWHGTADTTVDYMGSVNFINRVNAAGGFGVMRIMTGHGHSMGSGANIYNVECDAWFNRFRNA